MSIILLQEVLVRNTELTSHHQLEKSRKGQKETPCVLPPPRILFAGIHLGWAMNAPPGRTPESEWLAKDNLEINPVIIKLETAKYVAEQFSWVLLAYCSNKPFPIKSLAFVSTCVSSDNSFPSVRQKPSLRPWKGSSFLQQLEGSKWNKDGWQAYGTFKDMILHEGCISTLLACLPSWLLPFLLIFFLLFLLFGLPKRTFTKWLPFTIVLYNFLKERDDF